MINGWCPGRIIVLSAVSISRHIMASAAVASCCHGRRTLLALPRAYPQPGGKTLKIWPDPYKLAGGEEGFEPSVSREGNYVRETARYGISLRQEPISERRRR